MAIEKPLINSEEQLEGLRRPTAKLVPVRISLGRATGRKRARAMRVRVVKRPALVAATVAVEASGSAIDKHPAVPPEEILARSAAPPEAEAQHERAVRAGVPAWAAEAVAAGVVEVVVGGGGKPVMGEEIQMRAKYLLGRNGFAGFSATAVCFAFALLCSWPLFAQQQPSDASAQAQKTFATPKEAADALVQAAGSFDVPALEQILGPGSEDLVASEDPVRDKASAGTFAEEAKEKSSVVVDPKNPGRATLVVGNEEWPLPIPIVKRNGAWLFDTPAGRKEILYRRIGSNELDAIEICRGYVDAQQEYALERHDDSQVNQYAQKVISSPGKHDGLVWWNPDKTLGGPIAEEIADALQEGYTDKAKPYHGYFFKILKGQGPAAPLGEMNFVIEGAMIGGFALAAAPADYRVTGVKTFIVSYEGIVYQKDLGPDTLKIFKEMELYNPDKSWKPTDANWPPNAFAD